MLLPISCVKMTLAIYFYTFLFHCIVVHYNSDVITEKSRTYKILLFYIQRVSMLVL